MRVQYVPDPNAYVGYYLDQAGGGTGDGVFYRGSRLQRGYGIGSIFAKMFRFAMPLFKRGVVHVGKALGKTGANILADAAAGSDIKDSAKTHFKTMGKNLAGNAADYVLDTINNQDNNQDEVKQDGGRGVSGKSHKRKRKSANSHYRASHKRSKVDIFSS
jgi:hypothetical protein